MANIQKNKIEILIGLGIVIIYFLLRLPNLTLQPIFADEAIYIRWAQVMRAEPTLRFLPLTDGKTPLFMWSMMPLLKIFEDPLFAGRFLSVLSGFLTLAGVFFLARRVFNTPVALWAALIYTIVPYTVFFDRMALVDSMLSAFSIWALFLSIWLVQKPRLDLAMILGYLLGGGLLVKTPGMMNIIALPVTLLGFKFTKETRFSLAKLLTFWVVGILIAAVMYNLLRLGPDFQQLSSRNSDYVHSFQEILNRPWDPFLPHLRNIADWFPKLLTLPILLLGVFGTVRVILERNRFGLIIILWVLVPLLLQMIFLKTFTARYLLFSIPPFLILCGYGMREILRVINVSKLVIVLLVAFLPLHFNYMLLYNLQKAPLPLDERKGYLEDWTAGYGFYEIAQFLLEKKKEGRVVVGTEGYFGTLPEGLQIYLDKSDIPIIGGQATISGQIRNASKDNLTFFVANKDRMQENLDAVSVIKEFPKAIPKDGTKQDAIILYQVFPK